MEVGGWEKEMELGLKLRLGAEVEVKLVAGEDRETGMMIGLGLAN